MRILFLIFLLSACTSPHPAKIQDGTKAQQPAVQQPATQQPRKRRVPAPQNQTAPVKVQGSSIEAD